jgi:hypothetical protein
MTTLFVFLLFNSSYDWTLVGPQWGAGDYYSKNLPNFAAIITFIQLHTWHERGYTVSYTLFYTVYSIGSTGSRFWFCTKALWQAKRISKLMPLHFWHICCLGFLNIIHSSLGLSQFLQIYCPIFPYFRVFQDPFWVFMAFIRRFQSLSYKGYVIRFISKGL